MGAEFLAAAGGGAGGFYFEVEVLEAKGVLTVGVAGTNFGLQCVYVGNDACSWGYLMNGGNGEHGCAGQWGDGVGCMCGGLGRGGGCAGGEGKALYMSLGPPMRPSFPL